MYWVWGAEKEIWGIARLSSESVNSPLKSKRFESATE